MSVKIKQISKARIMPYGFHVRIRGLTVWDSKSAKDKEMLKVLEWVMMNCGEVDSGRWDIRGIDPVYIKLYFKEENDAAAFKMRWA